MNYLSQMDYLHSDAVAEKYLNKIGWSPKRILQGNTYRKNKGLPDFQCSNNRYVEVKKKGHRNLETISNPQLDRWKTLLMEGKKVYLMVLSKDTKKYDMFEIKISPEGKNNEINNSNI